MENREESEPRRLQGELTQGRQLASQLLAHVSSPSATPDATQSLLRKILMSYETALEMLKGDPALGGGGAAGDPPTEPPHTPCDSPRSEDSDRETNEAARNRKALPRWRQKVQMFPANGQELPVDEYSWRKYGQKDILGAKYPRSYYRCTHRHVQGCLATKLVQRSDEDPAVFDITYRGPHTCSQAAPLPVPAIPTETPYLGPAGHKPPPPPLHDPQRFLLDFGSGLTVAEGSFSPRSQLPAGSPSRSLVFPFPSEPGSHGNASCSPLLDPGFAPSGSSYFLPPPAQTSGAFLPPRPRSGEATAATIPGTESMEKAVAEQGFDPNLTFEYPCYFPHILSDDS